MTTKRYTGQYHESGLSGSEGLYYYNARWYDAYINRWAQPDTIIPSPGDPQSLNRYTYAANNPLRYVDPSGHAICASEDCVVRVHPHTGMPMGMRQKWGVVMTGPWEADNAWTVYDGLEATAEKVGQELGSRTQGDGFVREMVGGAEYIRWPNDQTPLHPDVMINNTKKWLNGDGPFPMTYWDVPWNARMYPADNCPAMMSCTNAETVYFFDGMQASTPVHEAAHVYDFRQGLQPSTSMTQIGGYRLDRSPHPNGRKNPVEDFGYSWTIWVLGGSAYPSAGALPTNRSNHFRALVVDWSSRQ